MNLHASSPAAPLGIVMGACPVRLWGMSGTERARRILLKTGVSEVADAVRGDAPCLLLRADWVVDPALLGLLRAEPPGVALTVRRADGCETVLAAHLSAADAAAVCADVSTLPPGVRAITCAAAAPIYLPALRKRLVPVVMPLTAETVSAAEKVTFGGAYKGVTDIVTKYLWPWPARQATRWCAERGITPNAVTLAGLLLTVCVPFLFAHGWFAAGLAAAWLMTFLDTVDGKLARCTLTYTPFGNVFDHAIDLISPPFWWWAWHVGCRAAGIAYPLPEAALAAVVGGYVVLRLQEGAFKRLFGMHIHVWRRFDSLFRLVVARRNPILLILSVSAILGAPGWGMAATAAWTVISVAVHATQMSQALIARRVRPIVSWMAE
ncbi:CDP-alcohol phosphatidyltransferase family protein [Oleispirillum naphthae]|uniref:CDP-alcohol phosphatidyltransferase family protein n=1 Tax=Oleispirillum naphthae TaxID=2838853 RepID=UPI003082386B